MKIGVYNTSIKKPTFKIFVSMFVPVNLWNNWADLDRYLNC